MSGRLWFGLTATFIFACTSSLAGCVAQSVPPPPPLAPAAPESTPAPQPTRGPTPQLALDPQPAPQSGEVRVSGSGFGAGESVAISVQETASNTSALLPLGDATTDNDGAFASVTLTLPDELLSGAHTLEAVGQTSQRTREATLWIRAPQPWLVLDNYDIPQYGDLALVAGGFEPMDEVQVSLEPAAGANDSAVQLTTFTTDQAGNGAWSQMKLPRMPPGTYNIVFRGHADAAELRREIRVTPLKPVVELSPWAGPPGSPVQLNVRGFAPGERVDISVSGDRDPSSVVAQADDYGNLWAAGPVRIPQTAAAGALTLSLVGKDSGATASADFKVLPPKPWLELTSWFGAPGAPVGFGGGGWIGGENVTIHMGSATNPTIVSATADDGGWLKGTPLVYIPLDVTDNVLFVALGEQSHLIGAATFTVVFPFGLHPQATQTATAR